MIIKDEVISPDIVVNYRNRFLNLNPNQENLFSKEALEYFRVQVNKQFHPSRTKILESNYNKKQPTQSTQLIGKLYFFRYKAVSAGHSGLSVYDEYPMVFFFNYKRTTDGKDILYGLNLHYLSPKVKQILLEKLLVTKSTKNINPNTRLKISWDIIRSLVSNDIANKAIHTYRVDRFVSKVVEIPANDWSIAVFLRLEHFVGVGEGTKITQSGIRKKIQK